MNKRYDDALEAQERAAKLLPNMPELIYDLAVIRLAAGKQAAALEALDRAIKLNPMLRTQAMKDKDLDALRENPLFLKLVRP